MDLQNPLASGLGSITTKSGHLSPHADNRSITSLKTTPSGPEAKFTLMLCNDIEFKHVNSFTILYDYLVIKCVAQSEALLLDAVFLASISNRIKNLRQNFLYPG